MAFSIQDVRRPKGMTGSAKRKGRGIGSGRGKTSGKGHKGAKARSGGGTYNPGFEGGQMPLIRRLPKRGFTNVFKKEWNIVNVGTLQKHEQIKDGAVIDKDFLLSKRLIRKKDLALKILGTGEISKALTVRAHAFSQAAKEAIEKAGGKIEIVKFK